jgi:hypothetical protein
VNLHAKKSGIFAVNWIVIRNITHENAIDEVLQVVSFCNNAAFVPVFVFNDGL